RRDMRGARAAGLLTDRERALIEPLRLGVAALGPIQLGEVVEVRADIGVVAAGRLLNDCERALIEPLRLGVAALVLIQRGEVVERLSDIGVVGAERLLANCQRALIVRLRLGIAALVLERAAEPRKGGRKFWMVLGISFASERNIFFRCRFRFLVISYAIEILNFLIEFC